MLFELLLTSFHVVLPIDSSLSQLLNFFLLSSFNVFLHGFEIFLDLFSPLCLLPEALLDLSFPLKFLLVSIALNFLKHFLLVELLC